MSHTLDYDAKFEEFANGDSKLVNFWDAYSIFGGLNLTQLDIVGNVAADERGRYEPSRAQACQNSSLACFEP
nr:geranylgeranyl transferase type-2 subunit alpha 1 [Tanacetum cinerariifolium]